jgi:hypothetical protein
VPVPHDAGVAAIGLLTIRQLNLFAHKAVLALHFEHVRQPLPMADDGGLANVHGLLLLLLRGHPLDREVFWGRLCNV